jgi:hypothetical protein
VRVGNVSWLRLTALAVLPASLTGCGNLADLDYQPPIYPDEWCQQQPCFSVGDAVLTQPLGTALVFLLAALWLAAGGYFWFTRAGQKSRAWFGAALALGGIGAALAGISFQTFGYMLKCAGRQTCQLTNGFEVGYSISQAVSVSFMVIAVAYACARSAGRVWLVGYAVANAVIYLMITLIGVLLPSSLLLSFEVLMLFAVPGIVVVFTLALRRYRESRNPLYSTIVWSALLLVLVQVAYFGYYALGITQTLWADGEGFYFSENDVLHVGMICWLGYVVAALGPRLRDLSQAHSSVPGLPETR